MGRSPAGGHGNTLQYSCWRITCSEEPGRLQSVGSHRVRHEWSDLERMNYLLIYTTSLNSLTQEASTVTLIFPLSSLNFPLPSMWSPESTHVSTSKYFLLHRAEIIKLNVCSVAQSCLTLCGSVDCSPPASSVHGIFHAGILEQVAISFSRRCSWPRDWTHISSVSCIGRWILYPSSTFILQYMQVFNFKFYFIK